MAEPLRVRVVFDGRKILRRSQRSEGLRRCWLLVKPEIATISDLASHVSKSFKLDRSCPHGLVLTMDGFVIPSFESIFILKDKDIIRVGKKDSPSANLIENGNNPHYIQDSEVVDKQRITFSDRLLATRELEDDSGEHKSKNGEHLCARNNTAMRTESPAKTKKRKHSEEIPGSKRKKSKSVISENAIVVAHGAKTVTTEKDEGRNQKSSSRRNPERKHEQPAEGGRSDADAVIPPQPDGSVSKRYLQCEENVKGNKCEKGTSRNALRKKAKRELLKEIKSQRKQGDKPPNVIYRELRQQETGLSAEMEKETFPAVLRRGSFRFQPLDEEKIQRQQKERMKTLHWNGTTRKKGEKWGRDTSAGKWNCANGYNEHSNGMTSSGTEKTGRSPAVNGYEQMNGKAISEQRKTGTSTTDFQSLFPLTRIPQVGDVLAYRLVELSSWCPEVSPFRVGQVTSYNYLNMSVILVPLPEYPSISENVEGRNSVLHANSSLYKEDGSLQIHYPSLVDVRLLKASDSEATASEYSEVEADSQKTPPVNNWELAVMNNSRGKESVIPPTAQRTEKGSTGGSTWDQIKQTINEKKAELEKKNGWNEWTPNKKTANTSWSYSTMRNSMGSTLSFLRGRNSKQAYRK